jgi:hypothetical protein
VECNHYIPRLKPGPPGNPALRATLLAEYQQTGSSTHSLGRK